MRVTQNITYSTYINDLMRKQESLYSLNNQLSTGKKINAPSDDPVNANKLLTSKNLLSTFEQYDKNIDSGLEYLNVAEKTLSSVKDVLTSVKEIAVSSATGTNDAATRASSGKIVGNYYDQLLSLANTNYNDRYIFSGFKTGTEPFDTAGNYLGDSNKYQVKTSSGSYTTIGVNGGEVFKGTAGGTDILTAVSDLRTALNANDSTGIQNAISTLDASFTQVNDAVSSIGGTQSRLNSAKSELSNSMLNLQVTISGIEDADITKVISDLRLGQVALEAAMSSAGKVFSINIFNYI